MSQLHKHAIPSAIADRALINPEQYQQYYQQSVQDPAAFWGEHGKILDWIKPYTSVKNTSSILVISASAGLKTVPLTWRRTAWTATWPNAATKPPSSGKVTIRPNQPK